MSLCYFLALYTCFLLEQDQNLISVSAMFYYYGGLQAVKILIFIFWLHSNEAQVLCLVINL